MTHAAEQLYRALIAAWNRRPPAALNSAAALTEELRGQLPPDQD